MREDLRRFILQLPLVDKDELLTMMRNAEAFLLEFETKQRAACLTPFPRDTDLSFPAPAFPPKNVPRPMEERIGGGAKDIKDRLGPRQEPTQDLRECNHCKKVGHIAKNCPGLGRNPLLPPPAQAARATTSGGGSLAAHVTKGATCSSCQKPGHVAAQCWSTHQELPPTEPFKKRFPIVQSSRAELLFLQWRMPGTGVGNHPFSVLPLRQLFQTGPTCCSRLTAKLRTTMHPGRGSCSTPAPMSRRSPMLRRRSSC